jgi:hypothetical protein
VPRPRAEILTTRSTPVTLERITGRPGEAHVGRLDPVRVRVRGNQPEHGVGTRKRLVDDIDVAVRPWHDLDTLARLCGKA